MTRANVTFGMLLRRHRLLVGLSQEELAERARVSLNAVGSLERGVNRRPHPRTVARLADVLACQRSSGTSSSSPHAPRPATARSRYAHRGRNNPRVVRPRQLALTCRWHRPRLSGASVTLRQFGSVCSSMMSAC